MVRFVALFCALLAAGCQSAIVSETGPLNITSVSVTTSPGVETASDIRAKTQEEANRQLLNVDETGKPVRATINIARVRYKNPGMALLVGDANSIEGVVELREPSGEMVSQFPVGANTDAQFQGVLGLVTAATIPPSRVDTGLARMLVDNTYQRTYGEPAPQRPAEGPPPPPEVRSPQASPGGAPIM